jgi:hypothetical protein
MAQQQQQARIEQLERIVASLAGTLDNLNKTLGAVNQQVAQAPISANPKGMPKELVVQLNAVKKDVDKSLNKLRTLAVKQAKFSETVIVPKDEVFGSGDTTFAVTNSGRMKAAHLTELNKLRVEAIGVQLTQQTNTLKRSVLEKFALISSEEPDKSFVPILGKLQEKTQFYIDRATNGFVKNIKLSLERKQRTREAKNSVMSIIPQTQAELRKMIVDTMKKRPPPMSRKQQPKNGQRKRPPKAPPRGQARGSKRVPKPKPKPRQGPKLNIKRRVNNTASGSRLRRDRRPT